MNSDDYGALEVSTVDRITTVVLNRPEARNAINPVLHDDLTRVFTDLDQDPDTDVAILTGAGGAFCAGGDIPWLRQLAGNVSEVERVIRADRRITESALTLEKPILAKVDGPAVGLGCSLASVLRLRLRLGALGVRRSPRVSGAGGRRRWCPAVAPAWWAMPGPGDICSPATSSRPPRPPTSASSPSASPAMNWPTPCRPWPSGCATALAWPSSSPRHPSTPGCARWPTL